MNRRDFARLVGCAAATWPLGTHAQRRPVPVIGFLGTASKVGWLPWVDAFLRRLGDLGWIEGRTVAIEYRWADGRLERVAEFAAELVRLKVDVIVTGGSAVPTIKRQTSEIPIVFALATDPVGGGLVPRLDRPGGNVTGFSNQSADLALKRIELLREMIPGLRRLAVLVNPGSVEAMVEAAEAQTAARRFNVAVVRLEVRRPAEIPSILEILKGRVDALYVAVDGLVAANRSRINAFALTARVPAVWNQRAHVERGALMSYGPDFLHLFRRTAEYVDKILRGAKPADLPIEQPTKFDFVVHLSTARALGLTIPESILLRADEVLE